MTCSLCGKPISAQGRNVWRWVAGYEKVRLAGEGVHPLKDREPSNAYVHGQCLENKMAGGNQESLAL